MGWFQNEREKYQRKAQGLDVDELFSAYDKARETLRECTIQLETLQTSLQLMGNLNLPTGDFRRSAEAALKRAERRKWKLGLLEEEILRRNLTWRST